MSHILPSGSLGASDSNVYTHLIYKNVQAQQYRYIVEEPLYKCTRAAHEKTKFRNQFIYKNLSKTHRKFDGDFDVEINRN